jgi:hypothetical protein
VSLDTVLIISEGFGNFVAHAALGYQFLVTAEPPIAIGIVSIGAQYSFTPHISLMAEAGFNATRYDEVPRYVSVAFVFYAL